MTDTPHRVRIDALPGSATVRLDGTDVSPGLLGYTVQHDIHGGLPTVMLHTTAHQGALFEGLARVVVAADHTPGETIAEFLANVDPQALEQAALNREDLDNNKSAMTRAILRQLTEWATSRDGGS